MINKQFLQPLLLKNHIISINGWIYTILLAHTFNYNLITVPLEVSISISILYSLHKNFLNLKIHTKSAPQSQHHQKQI